MSNVMSAIRMFLWLTLLTGIIYPLLITGIAQLTMKHKADGDFITINEKKIGAALIGQKFESDKYFWGRPSAINYNPLPSGGSNLGPTSIKLKQIVEQRQEKYTNINKQSIPSELLFASGSGIDPHISIQTAYFQIDRIAQARRIEKNDLKNLINKLASEEPLGFLYKSYVNVLKLNIALDSNEGVNP